jgi:hypothetical protein
MNLKDILAISGEGTLFKFIAQGKNAVIVENLETGRRFSAGASARVSALDEISIYTTGEDIPLGKVMDLIWEKENGGEALSHRQPDSDLKNYFAEILSEYDRERVYTSDIRKVIHWYNILHRLNLLVKEEEMAEEKDAEAAGAAVEAAGDVKDESGKEAPGTKRGKEKRAAKEEAHQTVIEDKTSVKTRRTTTPKGTKSEPANE